MNREDTANSANFFWDVIQGMPHLLWSITQSVESVDGERWETLPVGIQTNRRRHFPRRKEGENGEEESHVADGRTA